MAPHSKSIRKQTDLLGWVPASDRALCDCSLFSEEQISAIASDTRLPGEVGSSYGISAAIVIYIRRLASRRRRSED
jgi:hypothetical protein